MMADQQLQHEVDFIRENASDVNSQCDTNGDVKGGVCDVLPNNNDCDRVDFTQCGSLTAAQNDAILIQNLHNLYHGEGRSALFAPQNQCQLSLDSGKIFSFAVSFYSYVLLSADCNFHR